MSSKPRLKTTRPPTMGEKLGQLWGVLFLAMVVVLTALLVGKGCFGG